MYSNDFYFEYIPQLQNKIHVFNQSNKKLYQKFIKNRNKKFKYLFKELAREDLMRADLLNLKKIYKQSNSLQLIMEIKMSNFFSSKNIKKICLNPSNYASCEKLMEILIGDKSVKQYVFANSLLLEILIKKKTQRNIILKHLKSDKLESYLCYMESKSVEKTLAFDMSIMSKYLKIAKSTDEFEAAKQTSHEIFNSLKQQGIILDFDPKTCE